MKKSLWSINLMALSLIFIFSSCGGNEFDEASLKNSRRFNMINSMENLMVVGSIDLVGIIEKSDFENSKDAPFEAVAGYKMMVKNNLDQELTGIKLAGNNHFAVSMKADQPDYVVFTAEITNQEKVKTTLKGLKIFKGEYSKVEEGGKTFEFLSDKNVTAAWDDKDIIVVFGEKIDTKEKAMKLLKARYVDAPDNKQLAGYLKQTDDMNVYVNIETAMKVGKNSKEGKNITKEMEDLAKGAYYIGTGNFNTGDIVFEMNVFGEKLKNSEYNVISANAVSKSFLNYLTKDNLVGFGTASIDMSAIFNAMEMAQNPEFDLSDVEAITGMNKEEMQNLLTGEFSLSFIDIINTQVEMPKQSVDYDDFFEDDYSYNKEKPLILFAAGVSDTSKISKLIRTSGAVPYANGVFNIENEAYLAFSSDKMIVTTDEQTALFFASGNTFTTYELPSGLAMEKPLFGFYNTNPSKMPKGILKMAETEEGQMLLEFASLFKLVDFQGDFNKMTFKVEMNNKKDNALKVITDYVFGVVKDKKYI